MPKPTLSIASSCHADPNRICADAAIGDPQQALRIGRAAHFKAFIKWMISNAHIRLECTDDTAGWSIATEKVDARLCTLCKGPSAACFGRICYLFGRHWARQSKFACRGEANGSQSARTEKRRWLKIMWGIELAVKNAAGRDRGMTILQTNYARDLYREEHNLSKREDKLATVGRDCRFHIS